MNVTSIPTGASVFAGGGSSIRPETPFEECDKLRQRVQEIAIHQRKSAIEQRIEVEMERRLAEWSAHAGQYMVAEQRLTQLRQLANQQVRSDHLRTILTAAKFEMQRCTPGIKEAFGMLSQLTGTNISRESMQKFKDDSARLLQMADTIAVLVDGGQHLNQGPVVREFNQIIQRVSQNLNETVSNVKYLSEKTITVSSDVLMAKLLKPIAVDVADEMDDEEKADNNGMFAHKTKENIENVSPR